MDMQLLLGAKVSSLPGVDVKYVAYMHVKCSASVHVQDHRRLQTFALEGTSGGERQKYGAN